MDFRGLFMVPLISAVGAAIALALLFHPRDKKQSPLQGFPRPLLTCRERRA